jgi:hypothetical protein
MERKRLVREVLRRLCPWNTKSRCRTNHGNRRPSLPAVLETLRQQLEQVGRWRKSSRAFDDLAEQTASSGHDGPGTDWRFWHRTFREALTAEFLAEDHGLTGLGKLALAKAGAIRAEEDLSRWPSLALLAGRVDNPDDLNCTLVAANRPLGLRALATAQSLKDETLGQVRALSERRRVAVVTGARPSWWRRRPCTALLDQLRAGRARATSFTSSTRSPEPSAGARRNTPTQPPN